MRVAIHKYDLLFKEPAGTSRGILRSKRSWFLTSNLEDGVAVGECGLFAGLSPEDLPSYENVLRDSVIAFHDGILNLESLRSWPSIRCGWEMLLSDIASGGRHAFGQNSFIKGSPIPINGLIWMGNRHKMSLQIEDKLEQGFDCVKLKIGGIDFEEELNLLTQIRERFPPNLIEIRLDANGAFSLDEALPKLSRLAKYDIHSIEQPIMQGNWDAMAEICETSPIPIALDEELIGLHKLEEKTKLLAHISPQYIIIKPSLVGGFVGSDEWVSLAEQNAIQWWATSALESNIGLNAIAQWTASKSNPLPQGLGTGSLYTNNLPSPLHVAQGALHYDNDKTWDLSQLSIA